MLFNLLNSIKSGEGVDLQSVLIHLAVIALMVFLILPVHEFAHAGVAYLLGDKDVKRRGRLSLNPLVHVDIMGSLCMLLFGFGWAKPVPVNPNRFKYPKLYMGICALAGPVSNVLCGILGGAVLLTLDRNATEFLYATEVGGYVWLFLYYYVIINASLAVFNLIPIPPLDGSKVLFIFLPDRIVNMFYRYQQYTTILIFVLLYTGLLDGVLDVGCNFIENICLLFDDWLIYVKDMLFY